MRLLAGVLMTSLVPATAAGGAEIGRYAFPALQPETGRLAIHAAADVTVIEPLVRDFQTTQPGVSIEYVDYVTNDLQQAALAACEAKRALGDILLSSSVDQLVQLANDGCALPHVSAETESVADWANWRDEVFGFTFEPAVFVYNVRHVPPQDVPHTHSELAELLRKERYRGRVGTYDVRVSGIGFLLAFNDFRHTATFGRLLESMGRADVVVRCCTVDILREVAEGRLAIGYNMLGSYAYRFSLEQPDLRLVVPRDYALVVSRGALIPKTAPRRDLAGLFLDYLLSEQGQATVKRAFFFSKDGVPPDVDSPTSLLGSGIARPIRIGPALLAVQDEAQRKRFIEDWSRSVIDMRGASRLLPEPPQAATDE